MNEDREINNAVRQSDAFIEFCKTHDVRSFELFDSWVNEFVKIFESYNGENREAAKKSLFVITDFMEKSTPNEFIEFQKAFLRAGYACEICEIRDLKYEGGALRTAEGKKIDAVYRRAVTCDIMRHKDDVKAFLQAARENAVCIIGHFRTQVIHNKAVFKILHMPETLSFLTPSEREYVTRHIPERIYTARAACTRELTRTSGKKL
jgi:uncharacterized circularly permuted ATP-grasp superfamily protein